MLEFLEIWSHEGKDGSAIAVHTAYGFVVVESISNENSVKIVVSPETATLLAAALTSAAACHKLKE